MKGLIRKIKLKSVMDVWFFSQVGTLAVFISQLNPERLKTFFSFSETLTLQFVGIVATWEPGNIIFYI